MKLKQKELLNRKLLCEYIGNELDLTKNHHKAMAIKQIMKYGWWGGCGGCPKDKEGITDTTKCLHNRYDHNIVKTKRGKFWLDIYEPEPVNYKKLTEIISNQKEKFKANGILSFV